MSCRAPRRAVSLWFVAVLCVAQSLFPTTEAGVSTSDVKNECEVIVGWVRAAGSGATELSEAVCDELHGSESKPNKACLSTVQALQLGPNWVDLLVLARQGCVDGEGKVFVGTTCPAVSICKYIAGKKGKRKEIHRIIPLPAQPGPLEYDDEALSQPAVKIAKLVLQGVKNVCRFGKSAKAQHRISDDRIRAFMTKTGFDTSMFDNAVLQCKTEEDGKYTDYWRLMRSTHWPAARLSPWAAVLYSQAHLPPFEVQSGRVAPALKARLRSTGAIEQMGSYAYDRVVPMDVELKCPNTDGTSYTMQPSWLAAIKYYTVSAYRPMNKLLFHWPDEAAFAALDMLSADYRITKTTPVSMMGDLMAEMILHSVALNSAVHDVIGKEIEACGPVIRHLHREAGGESEYITLAKAYKKGGQRELIWNSFLSTSASKNVYVHTENEFITAYWDIQSSKCADITPFSAFRGESTEYECLFPPFTDFYVTKVVREKSESQVPTFFVQDKPESQ